MRPDQITRARAQCGGCPVRKDCLLYALLNNECWGVWGGLTHAERLRAMAAKKGSIKAVIRAESAGKLLALVVLP